MEIGERACLLAALLSPQLPKVRVDPSRATDLGLEKPEFEELVRHELSRLLSSYPGLARAADKAGLPSQDGQAGRALQLEMERVLRKDRAKLDALWALLEAGGRRSSDAGQAGPEDSRPSGRRAGRQMAPILAPLGSPTAVVLMAASAGVVIVGTETGQGATLLRWFAITVLACVPGWLFIRFIVFRAGALWTEYVLNLHRLRMDDFQNLPRPPMTSGYYALWSREGGSVLSAAPNIYQQKFEGYYGAYVSDEANRRRSVRDKAMPQVLLATLVFAVGWAVVLTRQPLFTGPLQLPVDSLRFAFLGAYIFILQMLIRRFFQSDLKASAYLGAVARIITVLITVLVVHHAAPVVASISPGAEAGLAFLIGFFPLLGMQIIQNSVSMMLRKFVPTLKTPYPLSDLDGLNIWYEARLLEEGIEDMQNLITANLVDIILHTRVPVGRLVDWIDQAALQVYLDPPDDHNVRDRFDDRNRLRRLGIRTATDLESAFLPQDWLAERCSSRAVCSLDDAKLVDGVRRVLNDDTNLPGINVVDALLKSFTNIPNLAHVRAWRNVEGIEQDGAESDATPAHESGPVRLVENAVAAVS
jgi:hypothetical protein